MTTLNAIKKLTNAGATFTGRRATMPSGYVIELQVSGDSVCAFAVYSAGDLRRGYGEPFTITRKLNAALVAATPAR